MTLLNTPHDNSNSNNSNNNNNNSNNSNVHQHQNQRTIDGNDEDSSGSGDETLVRSPPPNNNTHHINNSNNSSSRSSSSSDVIGGGNGDEEEDDGGNEEADTMNHDDHTSTTTTSTSTPTTALAAAETTQSSIVSSPINTTTATASPTLHEKVLSFKLSSPSDTIHYDDEMKMRSQNHVNINNNNNGNASDDGLMNNQTITKKNSNNVKPVVQSYQSATDNDKQKLSKTQFLPIMKMNQLLAQYRHVMGTILFALKYVTMDTKKRWKSFLVGLLTIVIVVFVVSILYNSVLKASVIFLKLSEDQVGETDVMINPRLTNSSAIPFVNETLVREKLYGYGDIVGTSPRWIMYGRIENRDDPKKNATAILLITDTKREKEIGIGRAWPHRPLGEGECHAKDNLLSAIGVESGIGQRVNVRLELDVLLQAFSGANQAISQDLNSEEQNQNENSDDGDSTATLEKSSTNKSGSNGFSNTTELLKTILVSAGVDFAQPIVVNLTEVADQLRASGTTIPPQFDILLESLGPVNVTFGQLFNLLLANNTGVLDSLGDIYGEYSVIDSISSPRGKFPPALGNVVMLDSKFLLRTVTDTMLRNFLLQLLLTIGGSEQAVRQYLYNFKVNEYALTVAAMYRKRFSVYTKNQNDRNSDIVQFTNAIVNKLGVSFPADITFPIIQVLDGLQFLRLFLDQIFVAVVVMLGILGAILIFTLLLANVEEKTYEYGMLRALGLQKLSLIQVILSHAFYFAIPGIICGMIGSFLTNIAIEFIIRNKIVNADYKIQYVLNWVSIVVPILLGLLIPLAANIVPIRTALSRTLRDSLDITHQTFNETTVKMIKLENLGVEPWQTAVSIALVVIGFVVYYIVPYSFLFQKLPLFFYIMNGILLGMLLGLCAIAVVLQPVLERIVLFFILIGPERKMHTLISKNLAGHRKRSRKTFLMFTLAIAFIIFAGVAFSLQVVNIVSNVKSIIGSDATIQSLTQLYPLPEKELSAYLNSEIANGTVYGYSYQTFDLTQQPFITDSFFSSLAYYSSRRVVVYGVSQNYLDVAYSQYFLYSQYDRDLSYKYIQKKPDVIDSLYTQAKKAKVRGEKSGFYPNTIFDERNDQSLNSTAFDPSEKYLNYVDIIVSEAMRPVTGINMKSPLQLRLYAYNPDTNSRASQDYLAKARSLVYKMPGYFYSSYQFTASGSPILVSFDEYRNIARDCAKSIDYQYDGSIPKQKILIRFRTQNAQKIVSILNNLKSLTRAEFVVINNVKELIKSTKKTTDALLGFFNVVAAIAIVLCFFVLAISFTGNVRDNSWEFGVLRSIGLSVNKLIRAYIYEALCLVVSAFFCGTCIGVVIAASLTAQFNVFLEMPFQFDFPYILFFTMMAMSLIVAVVGSYLPARILKKQQIALVLKGSA